MKLGGFLAWLQLILKKGRGIGLHVPTPRFVKPGQSSDVFLAKAVEKVGSGSEET
jgi:hypothetical protein